MKNKRMTKQEIRETFEDLEFCFDKLHRNALSDPDNIKYCITAFGITLDNNGFAEDNGKCFNMCIGDLDGVLANLSLIIETLAHNTHCTPGTIYSYLGCKLGIDPFDDDTEEF